jgi:dolichyl-phosphate beta-glucosyltransferase
MNQICIIIPCYNEAERFPLEEFQKFLSNDPETSLCLVNDGSTDETEKMLDSLRAKYPERILVDNLPENKGKAEAVRLGMLAALQHFKSSHFGFFDADLATRLEEATRLLSVMKEKPMLECAMGSRVAILGFRIERKLYRHLIGRIIATFISNLLGLMVYDTQCGAKLFTRSMAAQVFKTQFVTRWLFDVEILSRIIGIYGRDGVEKVVAEVPVTSWVDKGGSKVSWTYGFRVFFDLMKIRNHYRNVLD